jgi:putative transposase
MPDLLFNNRYRIPSTRLDNWNYGCPGPYFVTICTNGRYPFFGKIENGVMRLTEIGEITVDQLLKTPTIWPHVELDEWVVMPDHVHAIVVIKRHPNGVTPGFNVPHVETPSEGVSTRNNRTKHWASGTLGVIINQYKRSCTVRMRKIEPFFMWQPRYHDHIIRNDDELDRIREYIRNNPIKTGSMVNWFNVETPSEGV